MSDILRPHGLQHTRLPCPSQSPRACENSSPLSQGCHPTISSSVVKFSFGLQSFLASESFLMSWLFTSGDQSIVASASILPMHIQDWFHLGLTALISLQSKGLSRDFSNTKFKSINYLALSFLYVPSLTSSDFGAQENKTCHCFHCLPICLPWSDGTRCYELSFLNVEL